MKSPLESATKHFEAHLAAWRDQETGPALMRAALDETMGDLVANAERFSLGSCFTRPYGEFLDPFEVTLARLRELAGTA